MKEKTIKNSKGITLIALVITIIVLIILAGVSISLILDENGIIRKAQEGKENMQIAQQEEKSMLDGISEYIDNKVKGETKIGYDNPYIPTGFKHTAGTWNSGYTITETATGNKFVWVPCVLDQSKVKEGDTVVTFGRTLPSTTATTDPYYMYNKGNYTITGEENPASDIRTSVGTYGGFYIAAYEAGIEGTTENYSLTTKTATDGSVKPLSQEGKGLWNYITRSDAINVAEKMVDSSVTGVKSGLVSGEAWDTTLQWMVNASDNKETNAGYDTNSAGKGWYSDVSSSTSHTTGYYAINNIYDMAGNVWEWTTENCTVDGNSYLVERGGDYNGSGSYVPAAYRSYFFDNVEYSIGFRVLLYK